MKTLLPSSLLGALGLLLAPASVQATVLTFDIAGIADFQNVNQGYGDNVTAATMGTFTYGTSQGFTPDITLTYGNTSPALWITGYGTLTNVLFENADITGVLNLTFVGAAGINVRLHSFDVAAFTTTFAADPSITSVKVFDSANTELFSSASPFISKSTSTAFVFQAPLEDDVLRIEIDARNLGSLNDDIGMDNVVFSQVAVPEPASLALLLGGGALALRRTRRFTAQR